MGNQEKHSKKSTRPSFKKTTLPHRDQCPGNLNRKGVSGGGRRGFINNRRGQ